MGYLLFFNIMKEMYYQPITTEKQLRELSSCPNNVSLGKTKNALTRENLKIIFLKNLDSLKC